MNITDPSPESSRRLRVAHRHCGGRETLSAVVALARVPEDPAGHATLAAAWLYAEEHQRSARFLVDHARRDFLAGRIAAKTALRELTSHAAAPSTWAIHRGEQHQPVLDAHLAPFNVTLTHADGIGLAVAYRAHEPWGVDLELLAREAIEAIVSQVSPAEATWARANANEERMRWFLLWTTREALGKSAGTGLLDADVLRPSTDWRNDPEGWAARISGRDDVVVRAVASARHVVSFVLPESCDFSGTQTWVHDTLNRFVAET